MIEDVSPERAVLESLDAMGDRLPDGFVLRVSRLCYEHRRLSEHVKHIEAISDMQSSLMKLAVLTLVRERRAMARMRRILRLSEKDALPRRHLRSGRRY